MAIRIVAIRLSGGTSHEHIVHLWWTDEANGSVGDNTRAEIVAGTARKADCDDSDRHVTAPYSAFSRGTGTSDQHLDTQRAVSGGTAAGAELGWTLPAKQRETPVF